MLSILLLLMSLPWMCLSVLFNCRFATNVINVMDKRTGSKEYWMHDNDLRYTIHRKLAEKLIEKCGDFYDFNEYSYSSLSSLQASLDDFGNGDFINLFANDYPVRSTKDFDDTLNITYAGDIYVKDYVKDACFINVSSCEASFIKNSGDKLCLKPNLANSNDSSKTCDLTTIPCSCQTRKDLKKDISIDLRGVKVMSKSLAESAPDLLDFVTKLDFKEYEVQSREACLGWTGEAKELKHVLICSDDNCFNYDSKPYSPELRFKVVPTEECKTKTEVYKNSLLAVLAPAPFKMDYEFTVPTLFYKIPHMNPEYYSQFPNSTNLVSGTYLPQVFLRFIQDLGWRRIAIISDDTPYSYEFENKIVELFNKVGIIYNVQRCERKKCNMFEAVANLYSMRAKIVIANVGESNARNLQIIVEKPKFRGMTLLYRVHDLEYSFQKSVSITLGLRPGYYSTCKPKEWNINCFAVLNGLNVITQTARRERPSKGESSVGYLKKFYRSLNTTATIANSNIIAYVTRPTETGELKIYITMEISATGEIKTITHEKPFTKVPADEKPCYTKTNNFAQPCDETISLLFMFAVICFCIMVLVISCYFDSTSPIHARRYQQL